MDIYLTSDEHFGHANIIRSCGRPFADVAEMEEALIANHNALVRPSDTVYLMGDVAFRCPVEHANDLIRRLNGKKILLWGNHDNRRYDLSLFCDVRDFATLKVAGTRLALMHYPMLAWPGSGHGAIHCHGHSHNGPDYNERMRSEGIRRYDIGVDANSYFPVSAEAVVAFFGERG